MQDMQILSGALRYYIGENGLDDAGLAHNDYCLFASFYCRIIWLASTLRRRKSSYRVKFSIWPLSLSGECRICVLGSILGIREANAVVDVWSGVNGLIGFVYVEMDGHLLLEQLCTKVTC